MSKFIQSNSQSPLFAICLNSTVNVLTLSYLSDTGLSEAISASLSISATVSIPIGVVVFGKNATIYQNGNVIMQATIAPMASDDYGSVIIGGQDNTGKICFSITL